MVSSETPKNKFKFFIHLSQITLGILAFGFLMYIGKNIILPLLFALILSILINPIVYYFEKRQWCHRIVAILLAVFTTFLVVSGVVYFIASQLSNFGDALPVFGQRLDAIIQDCVKKLSETFHIKAKTINAWINQLKSENLGDGAFIGTTIATITGVLVYILLMPVYMFLFLYYKPLLLEFFAKLFPSSQHGNVADVLMESKKLIQSYLLGLSVEAIIVGTMNVIALLVIGVEYAILIGVIGALLNVIPYIGGITSLAIPMIVAMVSDQPTDAYWVLGAYLVIQFIDNNIIVPKIVASKVKVNALISIIAVFIGGAMWGVVGMFLSLPLIAIFKVIFDRIDSMKPWGFLIGDTMPSVSGSIFFKYKKRKKEE